MKNNIEYYPHYASSDQHAKFKMLRVEYGWEGEGKFWALNNRIAMADECCLDISKKYNKAAIASDLSFTMIEFDKFIKFLIKDCELLIECPDGAVTTDIIQETFVKVMKDRGEARERYRRASAKKQKTSGEKTHKVNESKVNESKVKQSGPKKLAACPYQDIADKFNSICKTLPRVITLNKQRKSKISCRWKEKEERQSLLWWEEYFKKVDSSRFLRGEKSDFSATFDWLINPTNMIKVLEGNYIDKDGKSVVQQNTCQICAKFCVPSSPDKCHKSATIKACKEFAAR